MYKKINPKAAIKVATFKLKFWLLLIVVALFLLVGIIQTVGVVIGGGTAGDGAADYDGSEGDGLNTITSGAFNQEKWDAAFSKAGVLKDKGAAYIKYAKQYQIDPVLLAAISFHETGWGTSNMVKTKNNVGGMMSASGGMVFASLDEGIERMANTIEALGSVYAPLGAANDPTGLNQNWIPTIKQYILELGGGFATGSGGGKSIHLSNKQVKKMMDAAAPYEGTPYLLGGTNIQTGIDCSALMQWMFRKIDINLPRTAQQQYDHTKRVEESELRPGDLVFYTKTYNAGRPVTHVAFYLGDGNVFQASGNKINYSSINNSYWRAHLYGFGRVAEFN
ncbi:NlpC/P60 family protein [Listeria monocytogenes]|uniref:C40 family peptidase n=1 Tax=Listeria monocytogenes TaxID=1639 RepID=UPI003204D1DE